MNRSCYTRGGYGKSHVTITLPKEGRVQVKKNQYLKKNKEV